MAGSPPKPPKPSVDEASAKLDRTLSGHHTLAPWQHAAQRGAERTFDFFDAKKVLDSGSVAAVSWHDNLKDWVYWVQGRTLDGDDLAILVYVEEAERRISILTGK